MGAFLADLSYKYNLLKSTSLGEKRPKMTFFGFWLCRETQENLRVFRALILSQNTNFHGGGRGVETPLAMRM